MKVMKVMKVMKQASFGLKLTAKQTRKQVFLDQVGRIVPWSALVELIAPYAPRAARVVRPFALETMLRLRDPEMHWAPKSNPWHFSVKARIGVDIEVRWCIAMRAGQGGSPVSGDLAFGSRPGKDEIPRTEDVETLDGRIQSTCTRSKRPPSEDNNPAARTGSRWAGHS